MNDEKWQHFLQKIKTSLQTPPPPLDAANDLLACLWDAGDLENFRNSLNPFCESGNPQLLWNGLYGLNALLSDAKIDPKDLFWMVVNTGWVLEDNTYEGARKFLHTIADIAKETLAAHSMPLVSPYWRNS